MSRKEILVSASFCALIHLFSDAAYLLLVPHQIRRMEDGSEKETLCIGLACSECFSGPRLAKLLQAGFEYERKVMEDLIIGNFASPLSIHTSGGVPEALSDFVEALEPHLPWKDASQDLDWCVSLQLEGASAVWAAVDLVLQEAILSSGNKRRTLVAVGATSYHGPPSTSAGAKSPMWTKNFQVKYPVPEAGKPLNVSELLKKFEEFLDQHGDDVGVILVEPQWGSSQAAFPWPKSLLKAYIEMAQARGIRVVADEIMCGLGRHGQGSLFISKDWDLDPDAVTFGKAIGGGVYPISGAILKRGRDILCKNGHTVMQSHTYAGSSVRALMTATEVLREIPMWLQSVTKLGQEMSNIFKYISKISGGALITHGQGLMWGCLFSREGPLSDASVRSEALKVFRKRCDEVGVLPYIVPAGGFMVTPVVDIDVGTVYEIGEKLVNVVQLTMKEMGWKSPVEVTSSKTPPELVTEFPGLLKCQTYLHTTRSCTSCTKFVCPKVRTRFS